VRRCLLAFEPPDGGVADHVLRLAAGLRQHGWEPAVAGPERSAITGQLGDAGIRYVPLPWTRGYSRPWSNVGVARALAAAAREVRPDLMHLHSSKAGAVGRPVARRAGVPAVYTPNCFAFMIPGARAKQRLLATVERRLTALTASIICVAEDERRAALRARVAPPGKLRVIHNGAMDCPSGLEPDPELTAFAAGGPTAACIVVLRKQKAVDTLLDAAPAVLARVPDARIAIVGDGPERPALEARARALGLGERVRFFAFRPPPARQLASADVFVLPSAYEAFPIAILEAMACGVPQVATTVGGVAEAVVEGETGRLCPPGDPPALAEALVAVLDDPGARARMGSASAARHAERFTVGRMVAATAEEFDRVMTGAHG
jgi:glycosyltransferase involved in cell wall biosynthesis